jgi:hypothetical protein
MKPPKLTKSVIRADILNVGFTWPCENASRKRVALRLHRHADLARQRTGQNIRVRTMWIDGGVSYWFEMAQQPLTKGNA